MKQQKLRNIGSVHLLNVLERFIQIRTIKRYNDGLIDAMEYLDGFPFLVTKRKKVTLTNFFSFIYSSVYDLCYGVSITPKTKNVP